MRKTVAVVVAIIVGASCVPWLRHQHFFSILAGLTVVALAGVMLFAGVRTLSVWAEKPRPGQIGFLQPGPRLRKLPKYLLGAGVFAALMLTVPHFMETTSGMYKLAVATAHQSPQFMGALGEPVSESWFADGKWQWGDPATGKMLIPVKGRIRRGTLRVSATKNGRWKLTELTLEVTQPDEHIDLLQSTPSVLQDH